MTFSLSVQFIKTNKIEKAETQSIGNCTEVKNTLIRLTVARKCKKLWIKLDSTPGNRVMH